MLNHTFHPTVLSEQELSEVLKRVSPRGKEYGAARICRMLAEETNVQTVRVNTRCSVGNISDQVNKLINPRIADLGLYVACIKPHLPINNKFGQPSGQMLWSFYRDQAANDPLYDSDKDANDFKNDFRQLQAEYPDLPLTDDYITWESQLIEAGVE